MQARTDTPEDIAEVICMIIPHLPIYHYKGKEAKVRLQDRVAV